MGLVALIKSFRHTTRKDAKISTVKSDDANFIETADHFSSPGDDSFPLEGDYVIAVDIKGTGQKAAVGYADIKNDKKSIAGEKRFYGRNTDGDEVNEIYLKQDGSVLIQNDNGSIEIESGGNIIINGVTIDTDGNIGTAGSLTAASAVIDSKELKDHTHSGVTTGPSNTGTNN